jgi:hypothetical protein
MKINIYLWSYLAQVFLKWETFYTKVVEKIKKKRSLNKLSVIFARF